ncbi:MAG: SprT family zinc-dependent metalloprotease [Woeseiaceae bacterium]|jgi:predicted metal-dependent hydrolase
MQTAVTQLALFPETDEPDPESGFSVRRSGRARRLSIKVYPRGRVEVVVPRRTSARAVQAFVESHRDWINNTRAAFAAEHPSEPFALPSRINLPAIDRAYCVRYERATEAQNVRYRTIGSTIVLSGATDDEKSCVAALRRWLTALAKKEFLPRLRALSAETGNAFQRMQVRGQRTCWGSHSGKGTVSLNFCLLFLEPRQLRYVLVHELCHARHMDHSARFWRLVGRFEPDYRQLDKGLNDAWTYIPTWVGLY